MQIAMNSLKLLLDGCFLIACLCSGVSTQVFELTLQNFDQFTKDKDVMLVEFFAPWCHHCQELQPEWEKAASALAVNREFILGKADCVNNGKDLCDRFQVQMYPTIKLFRHGVFKEDFDGDRNADAIVRYLQQAQSQAAAPQAPEGQTLQPNNDPWQSGASFQYAYPMTTPPVVVPAVETPAPMPVQNYAPTPEAPQIYPPMAKAETKPVAAPPVPAALPATTGNLWFDNLWNRNKAPAPSMANTEISHISAPQPYYPFAPQRPNPHAVENNMATSGATSSYEYHSRDNMPFQAQTSTTQIGFKPPVADLSFPANPLTGSYAGQLNTQNNQFGTSVINIDGRPYAIRRIVNRFSNQHLPININSFQPFQRMVPGYLRGDNIPHYGAPQMNFAKPVSATPQRQIIPLRLPSPSLLNPAVPQQTGARQSVPMVQRPAPMQKAPLMQRPSLVQRAPVKLELIHVPKPGPKQQYDVVKPDYFQMFANFLRAKKPENVGHQQTMPGSYRQTLPRPTPSQFTRHQPTQSEMNQIFENYKRKLVSELRSKLPISLNAQKSIAQQRNGQGRFVISIKGRPGSSAVQAIRNKALHTPGFLNSLLNGRSSSTAVQQQQKQRQQQQQAQRRQMLLHQKQQQQQNRRVQQKQQNRRVQQQQQNRRVQLQQRKQAQQRQYQIRQNGIKRVKIHSPFVNVPLTDRALVRAKVLRPDLMARAKWAAKGATKGTTRGNIVYVPRSAFSRLPSWYRPKLGPALVKYVVKAKDGSPLPMLAQANKKTSLSRPPPPDLWHQIYNFYNNKNEVQSRDAPYRPKPNQNFARFMQNHQPQNPAQFASNQYTQNIANFEARQQQLNFEKFHQNQQQQNFARFNTHQQQPNFAKTNQKFSMPKQPQVQPGKLPIASEKYYVSQPQYRVRGGANSVRNGGQQLQAKASSRFNAANARKYPGNARNAVTNGINSMMQSKKLVKPELWDKRSFIRQNGPNNNGGKLLLARGSANSRSNAVYTKNYPLNANNAIPSKFNQVKAMITNKQPIPPELWDKRNNLRQQLINKHDARFLQARGGSNPRTNANNIRKYPTNVNVPSKSDRIKTMIRNKQPIPAELWDKRNILRQQGLNKNEARFLQAKVSSNMRSNAGNARKYPMNVNVPSKSDRIKTMIRNKQPIPAELWDKRNRLQQQRFSKNEARFLQAIGGSNMQSNAVNARKYPTSVNIPSKFEKIKTMIKNKQPIPPELWDKRNILRQQGLNKNDARISQTRGGSNIRPSAGNARKYPTNVNIPSKSDKIKTMIRNKQPIPPELWDKRSIVQNEGLSKKSEIPSRPTRGGNWGTLKKKRSLHHRNKLRRKRRYVLRNKLRNWHRMQKSHKNQTN